MNARRTRTSQLRTRLLSSAAALTVAVGVVVVGSGPAFADTISSGGFESFTLGNVNGQFGWSANTPNPLGIDEGIADPAGVWGASLGSRALRISNAVTSGNFTSQMFSASNVDAAGETNAATDGTSGGIRQERFTGSFDFASVTPNTYQPGLMIGVAPDNGSGARMSQFRFYDTPTGLKVTVIQYDAPTDNFVETTLADNLDRTRIHHFTFSLDLVDGPDNDILTTNFDGCRTTRIGSWEEYHRSVAPGNPTHTVDSLLIRASGTAAPSLAGDGFYFDNVVTTTGATPPAPPAPGVPSAVTAVSATTAGSGVRVSFTAPVVNDCAPVTRYTITATPTGGGARIVITSSTTSGTIGPLTPGATYTITVVATNSFGDGPASASLTYLAAAAVPPPPTPSPGNPNGNLPDTGADIGGLLGGGIALILAGAGALWYSRARHHGAH